MLLVATTVSGQKILNGDLNHDGKIDIADVTAIVDVSIGRSQAEEFIIAAPLDIAPHEYVDLELPSGTLWATCNVGATNPEDFGDYFAWGETEGVNSGKHDFEWSTYKYYKINGNVEGLTKYCSNSRYGYEGFTDSLTVLAFTDDAATANWGWGGANANNRAIRGTLRRLKHIQRVDYRERRSRIKNNKLYERGKYFPTRRRVSRRRVSL